MALERPIVMGVNGIARDMVADAGCGINITPESDDELFECVCRLADDPAGCRQIGARARAHVARHFNRDVLAERYVDLLHQVVAQKRNGKRRTRVAMTTATAPNASLHRAECAERSDEIARAGASEPASRV
jgi:hypothetical protein